MPHAPRSSRFVLPSAVLVLAAAAHGQISSVNLSAYTLHQTINLPAAMTEASSITYNWDTNRLYLVPDTTAGIFELSLSGTLISQMYMSGFEDTEGITYLGNGQFAIAEERLQQVYKFTYIANGVLVRSSLQNASLGEFAGNDGIEGLSYEPLTGYLFAVKEKNPTRVMRTVIDWPAGTASIVDLFNPSGLGVADVADICVLSTVPSLVGTPDQNNLLLISQASSRLLKVSRTGAVLGQMNLSGLSTTAEGVTIDPTGTIYICDESPKLFIFKPPACYPNCDGSTGNPALTSNDFQCFLNKFASSDTYANCDQSTGVPLLTANDFQCFLNKFAAGCP
jgi:uncharacterized protein YjiK